MKTDIYQTITDRIIEQLENNEIPWKKPWIGVNVGAFNRVSKKPYSLLNQLLLKHTGEYASFKQWSELGGKIRKGEKSEIVVFWSFIEKKDSDQDDETVEPRKVPILKYYRVFHISQVEGVKPLETHLFENQSIPSAEELIKSYVTREGINYNETLSNDAFYSPLLDCVSVPSKAQYANVNEFYSTVFHELTHSTGHKSRLNRFTSSAYFGNKEYSKEELIAEIGSATLLNICHLETEDTFSNNAAYIKSWLKKLKDDKRFIVSAAGKSEKAVKLIITENADDNENEEITVADSNEKVISLSYSS